MKRLNAFLLFLVSSFLPSLVFSLEELTDPSEMSQEEIWIELGKNYEENSKILDEREMLLNKRENNLDLRERILNERENSISARENLMNEIDSYLKNLKEDRWKQDLEFFGIGALTAFSIFSALHMMNWSN